MFSFCVSVWECVSMSARGYACVQWLPVMCWCVIIDLLPQGGELIYFRGSNFGPVGAATAVSAWAQPASLASGTLVFWAPDCNVTEDHFLLMCRAPEGCVPFWRCVCCYVRAPSAACF